MARIKLSTFVLAGIAVFFVVGLVGLVARSLLRPDLETFVPSAIDPKEVGAASLGPTTYTVDARVYDDWAYFDFSRASRVEIDLRSDLDWDIAFQRHRMLTNGGATNPAGQAAVIDLGPVPLESAFTIAGDGLIADERRGDTPRNRVLEEWYEYSWTTHILQPADRTFALRTADGRYAALRVIGYYCPGGRPGCVTFTYRYRGDGGRTFPAVPLLNGKEP